MLNIKIKTDSLKSSTFSSSKLANSSKYQYVEFNKENICTIVKNSKIQFLAETNELSSDSYFDFIEFLNMANYVSNNIDYDWMIISNFLNKKTVYEHSKLIKENSDPINSLTEFVPPKLLMKKMKYDLIYENIPHVIKELGLCDMYEQLIFYEYIYKSEKTSYLTKAIIMCENNYEQLLTILEDYHLELCTTTEISSQYDEMIQLYIEYFNTQDKCRMFTRFIDIHSNWLDFDCNFNNPAVELLNLTNESKHNLEAMNIEYIIKKIGSKTININHFCLLTKSYKKYPEKVLILFDKIIPIIDWNIQRFLLLDRATHNNNNINSFYKRGLNLYLSLDFLVELMEHDCACLSKITKNTKNNILSLWLKMSSPQYIDLESNGNIIRNIILSQCIQETLSNSNLTFSEMKYILFKDRLDMFKILCKNLEFKTIHKNIFEFLSPKIIKYVIEKSLLSNKITNIQNGLTISFNVYNLLERNPQEIIEVLNILNTVFEDPIIIECASVIDKYDFVECAYIMIYWEYLNIINNFPILANNIIILLASIKNYQQSFCNYDIDLIVLRTLLDRVRTIDNTTFNNYINKIQPSLVSMQNKKKFFTQGPNFHDIYSELNKYGVQNLEYITSLCQIVDNMCLDNVNENDYDNADNETEDDNDGNDNTDDGDDSVNADDDADDSVNVDEEDNTDDSVNPDNTDDGDDDGDDDKDENYKNHFKNQMKY